VTGTFFEKKMRRHNNSWSDADIERLKALVASGASPHRTAVVLKRTMMSVQTKARLVGAPFPSMLDVRKKLRASMKAKKERGFYGGVLYS
jgi:hypothetical protein